MREVFNNYQKYKKEALESSKIVRKEWDWKVSTQTMIKRIEDIYYNKLWKLSKKKEEIIKKERKC